MAQRIKVTDEVFRILDSVMKDNEPDVKKAVSWILREITKTNPKEVFNFLTKWASKPTGRQAGPNKDTKWIIKDGVKKLGNDEQKRILKLLD